MGWGNGIGIAWPNASASAGPPVPQESYILYNCVGEETLYTDPYLVGSFLAGDRVLINEGYGYGYIDSTTPSTFNGWTISNLPIGYQPSVCIDSNVVLTSSLIPDPDQLFKYLIELKGIDVAGLGNVVVSDPTLDYNIAVRINYEAIFNDGALIKTGFVDISTNTYDIEGSFAATIATVFAFNVPPALWVLTSFNYYMEPLTIQNTYGPYNISDGYSRFLTNYGNAWAFNWPFEF